MTLTKGADEARRYQNGDFGDFQAITELAGRKRDKKLENLGKQLWIALTLMFLFNETWPTKITGR